MPRPANLAHRGVEPQARAPAVARCDERGQQRFIAVPRPRRRIPQRVAGPFGGERARAGARGVRRVEAFRHRARTLPLFGRENAAELLEKVIEGHVVRGERGVAVHRRLDVRPGRLARLRLPLLERDVRADGVDDRAARLGKEAAGDGGRAVDELRPELDRHRHTRFPARPDASTEPLAGLQQQHLAAGLRHGGRRGQAGGAGADDDHVAGGVSHRPTVEWGCAVAQARFPHPL